VTPQSGNQVSTSLGNIGLCWTVFARNRDTAVPAEGNGNLQTLICVLVARPRRCLTLSNPVPWQNWMVAYLGYTLRMRTLFRGWPIMVNDTHTRRRIIAIITILRDQIILHASNTLTYITWASPDEHLWASVRTAGYELSLRLLFHLSGLCIMLAGFSSVTMVVTVKRHSEWRRSFITNKMWTSTSECRAQQVHNNINVAFLIPHYTVSQKGDTVLCLWFHQLFHQQTWQ